MGSSAGAAGAVHVTVICASPTVSVGTAGLDGVAVTSMANVSVADAPNAVAAL